MMVIRARIAFSSEFCRSATNNTTRHSILQCSMSIRCCGDYWSGHDTIIILIHSGHLDRIPPLGALHHEEKSLPRMSDYA